MRMSVLFLCAIQIVLQHNYKFNERFIEIISKNDLLQIFKGWSIKALSYGLVVI